MPLRGKAAKVPSRSQPPELGSFRAGWKVQGVRKTSEEGEESVQSLKPPESIQSQQGDRNPESVRSPANGSPSKPAHGIHVDSIVEESLTKDFVGLSLQSSGSVPGLAKGGHPAELARLEEHASHEPKSAGSAPPAPGTLQSDKPEQHSVMEHLEDMEKIYLQLLANFLNVRVKKRLEAEFYRLVQMVLTCTLPYKDGFLASPQQQVLRIKKTKNQRSLEPDFVAECISHSAWRDLKDRPHSVKDVRSMCPKLIPVLVCEAKRHLASDIERDELEKQLLHYVRLILKRSPISTLVFVNWGAISLKFGIAAKQTGSGFTQQYLSDWTSALNHDSFIQVLESMRKAVFTSLRNENKLSPWLSL